MRYFQYLDLNWQPVATKLKEFANSSTYGVPDDSNNWRTISENDIKPFLPDICEMLLPLNVYPVRFAFYVSTTSAKSVHIDYGAETCRFLMPVQNCEGTFTQFFKTFAKPEIRTQLNKTTPYYRISYEDCVLDSELELTSPVLIRPKEPHRVVTQNAGATRISFTMCLNRDLTYMLE